MKICSKCNTQVSDDLQFCPSCGNSLESGTQVNNNSVQQPTQQLQNPVDVSNQNKMNYKLIISILAGVVVICSIIAIVFGLKLFDSKDANSENNSNNEGTEVSPVEDSNVVSYDGFDFTLPDGYVSHLDNGKFTIEKQDDPRCAFGINVGRGAAIDEYYQAVINKYPDLANKNIKKTIGGHTYILWATSSDSKLLGNYVFDYGDGYVFYGQIVNPTYTMPTEVEVGALDAVLPNAKSSSSFAPNDIEDVSIEDVINKKDDLESFEFSE